MDLGVGHNNLQARLMHIKERTREFKENPLVSVPFVLPVFSFGVLLTLNAIDAVHLLLGDGGVVDLDIIEALGYSLYSWLHLRLLWT